LEKNDGKKNAWAFKGVDPSKVSMKITVSATQLGSLFGLQKPLYAAFESVWKRSYPRSYYDAIRRNKIMLEEDTIQATLTVPPPTTSHECRKMFSSACKMIQHSNVGNKTALKKAMKKTIYTSYGDAAERALFDHVHKTMFPLQEGVQKSAYMFTVNDYECVLCGKTDAMSYSSIVELKNRVHRLMTKQGVIPPHEYVQCLSYLHLIPEAKKCDLIECVTTKKNNKICHVTKVVRDERFWNTVVIPALVQVVTMLTLLLESTSLQDQYMQHYRCHKFKQFMTYLTTKSLP
jgi:hypothetical protein